MSQLADVTDAVRNTNLPVKEQAELFLELLSALRWEIDGVDSVADAEVFLTEGFS